MCRTTTCSLKIRYTQGLCYANVLVAICSFKMMIHARMYCAIVLVLPHMMDPATHSRTRNVSPFKSIRHSLRHEKGGGGACLEYDDAVTYFEMGKG
jgi:hypothetical protein